MTTIPTPATVFANRKVTPAPAQIAAEIKMEDPGKIVRPGLVPDVVESIHDGVVKTKHLQQGQRVRPYVHGRAVGGERVVKSIERLQGGAVVLVTWASKHAPSEHKAAYRWFDASLVGTTIQTVIQKPGFVNYQEV